MLKTIVSQTADYTLPATVHFETDKIVCSDLVEM